MTKNQNIGEKSAFTLAEVLISLTVLGIIASLTIPTVIQKQREAANRTKIKKAMTVYDHMFSKMVVENNLKSNQAVDEFAAADCSNTLAYFKVSEFLITQDDQNNKCLFKTSDGIYWNISDIKNPIIAITKDDLTKMQNGEDAGTNAFKLSAWFDDKGSLRVDDLAAATDTATKVELTKLYNFINNVPQKALLSDEEIMDKFNNGDYDNNCNGANKACTSHTTLCIPPGYTTVEFAVRKNSCNPDETWAAMDEWITYDDNGNILLHYYYGHDYTQLYNSKGEVICQKYDINSKSCSDSPSSSQTETSSKITGANKEISYSDGAKAVLDNFDESENTCDKITYTAANGETITFSISTSDYLEAEDGQFYSGGEGLATNYVKCNGSPEACASYSGATSVEMYTMPLGMINAMGMNPNDYKTTVYQLNNVKVKPSSDY